MGQGTSRRGRGASHVRAGLLGLCMVCGCASSSRERPAAGAPDGGERSALRAERGRDAPTTERGDRSDGGSGLRPVRLRETEWTSELEKGGRVEITEGRMVIDVPGGATVWYRPELSGPVEIAFTAVAVSAGGKNDRVSDLNVFWMARENDGSSPVGKRGGAFREYDTLRTYYASVGGNGNTTTRFRRYIGERDNRPLLPEHDLRAAEFLLVPNVPTRIRLVADGRRVEVWRDGRRLFEFTDPEPYTSGRFAVRTVASHVVVSDLRVAARK